MKKMFKKAISILLCTVMVVTMFAGIDFSVFAVTTVWDGSIADSFDSGTGTEDDPYIIRTAEQLALLAQSVNSGNSYSGESFRLESDIILNDTTNWEQWGSYNDAGNLVLPINRWSAIGYYSNYYSNVFCGIFDGNGHTVSGLFQNYGTSNGLFGYVKGAVIKDLLVEKSFIKTTLSYQECYVGGIVGRAESKSQIIGCGNKGTVICSKNSNSYFAYVGGVAGYCSNCMISCCFNTGNVNGTYWSGGIVGECSNTEIIDCYNAGPVFGEGTYYVGGIVGRSWSDSTIERCYNVGTLSGKSNDSLGGIACKNSELNSLFADCYCLDSCVPADNGIGELLTSDQMQLSGSFENWNFEKTWEFGFEQDYPYPTLRRFGSKEYRYRICYYDGDVLLESSMIDAGDEITIPALDNKDNMDFTCWIADDVQYHAGDKPVPADDINFQTLWTVHNTSAEVWDGSIDTEWEGKGTKDEPYLITSAAELAGLAHSVNTVQYEYNEYYDEYYETYNHYSYCYFSQAVDITLNDGGELFSENIAGKNVWTPIGENHLFCGHYDGGGHTIYGLYVVSDGYCGLFGNTPDYEVQNINVYGAYVKAGVNQKAKAAGGIVGDGDADNCTFTGNVAGRANYFGGVVGYGDADKCTFTGSVTGQANYIGGIVGEGNADDCSFTGSVSGNAVRIGGISGNGRISNSNFEGSVSGKASEYLGGIAGDGSVENGSFSGTVSGRADAIGGIVGGGSAKDCTNNGIVSGYSSKMGGISGCYGQVSNCKNYGAVTCTRPSASVGGIAGSGSAENCENIGCVTGIIMTSGIAGAGGIVGEGSAKNCTNRGKVCGGSYAGGISGNGSAENCANYADVDGGSYVGGITGEGAVADCLNTGTINGGNGYSGVGGISGSGSAQRCRNTGEVTGAGYYTGGIVGMVESNDTVTLCYNTGSVNGNRVVGGIVGEIEYSGNIISDCYNTGVISGCTNAGGIVGSYSAHSNAEISNCYNIGSVSGEKDHSGSIVGYSGDSANITNCYYLKDIAQDNEKYGAPLTAEQMKNKASFENWNFNKTWEIGYDKTYLFPTLKCFGSKDYYYELRFYDEEELCKSKLVRVDGSYTFDALNEKEDMDFGYWISDDQRFYAKDEIIPTDDMVFHAMWTTRNTSADVWDGSIDTEWDGDGTYDSPYLITSPAELAGLAQQVNSGTAEQNAYYSQTVDIVLNDGGDRFCDHIAGKNDWTPIGTSSKPFSGTYLGNGASISGMYRYGDGYSGLFGYTRNSLVKGIVLEDSYVKGTGNYTAGIVAYSDSGSVVDCTFEGTVTAYGQCGGIVSSNNGGMVNICHNNGTVTTYGQYSSCGGVAGSGYVANSYNAGSVNAFGNYCSCGGVVGSGYGSNCYNSASGSVYASGGNSYAGGVVGSATGYISNSRNLGSVEGMSEAGGVVASSNYGIENCYNKGSVKGKIGTGGIVGTFRNYTIRNCYNEGNIEGNSSGGIAYLCYDARIVDCYNATSDIKCSGGIAYLCYDSRIEGCYNTGNIECQGGIMATGYNVSITDCYNTGNLTGKAGILESGYSGTTVSRCYNTGDITGSGYNTGGIVANGTAINCFNSGNITSSSSETGGIVGDGTAINCYNTGDIYCESSYVGGVAGNGTASYCYNSGFVRSTRSYVGGIVGSGSATNSYNTGEVSGKDYVGGIAGYTRDRVELCYNIGAVKGNQYVGGITGDDGAVNSYYLTGCVEKQDHSDGTALTQEEMTNAASYTGFDFDNTWEINAVDEYDYPTLQNVEHAITYTVTFLDRNGDELKRQTVKKGYSAYAPYVPSYSDGVNFYSFDHWDKDYYNVIEDITVTAFYKQVAIIKFTDITVPFTVEHGFSRDELRVQLEAYLTRKLCTTTNGYKMRSDIVWNEDDLEAYDPNHDSSEPVVYTIRGVLKITDPAYSNYANYYDMAEGAGVKVLVTVLPGDAEADHFTQNDLEFEILDDGGSVRITGYNGRAAEVVLPDTINGYAVTAIADHAFDDCDSLTAIYIPSGIKRIGEYAFSGCTSLLMVSFEEGVESIGERAFFDTSLICATIPESVTEIGGYAFGYYGEDQAIEGFEIYCYADSAGEAYANGNGFLTGALGSQYDDASGIYAIVEDSVTLVVDRVEEGGYYDTAQQIVQENDDVALFEIKTVDREENEVQPGNVLTLSIPVPEGFDAQLCRVYRINSDGSIREMNAKLLHGMLVFNTPHLSYYAIVEEIIEPPTAEAITSTSVLLERKDGCEYRCGEGEWQTEPLFDGLSPDTEYSFYTRLAATDDAPASDPSDGTVIRTAEPEVFSLFGAISTQNIPDVSVTLTLTQGEDTLSSVTATNGAYRFDGLVNGIYVLTVSAEKFITVQYEAIILDGDCQTDVELVLAENTAESPTVEAVTQTSVRLAVQNGCEYRCDDGEWQTGTLFEGLTPDTEYTFYARIAADGYYPAGLASKGITVRTEKPKTFSLSVTITTQYNIGVPVTMTLMQGDNKIAEATTTDNAYVFENLISGSYTLSVSANDYEPRQYEITVSDADSEAAVELFMKASAKHLLGDVDGDGAITILDATCIQRQLVNLSNEVFKEELADVDEDKKITILDATEIQRFLAGLSTVGKNIGVQV